MSKEMTAIEYLKEKRRMCRTIKWCDNCPMNSVVNNENMCAWIELKNPEEAVAIVQKWAEEHPIKTRQSEFLKIFPGVKMTNGYIGLCPRIPDERLPCLSSKSCAECRKDFWLAEMPEVAEDDLKRGDKSDMDSKL